MQSAFTKSSLDPATRASLGARTQLGRHQKVLVCKASSLQAELTLPASLKNNVVVLDAPNPDVPGGTTKVYLLGMSHVSKNSVKQIKELIRAVKPDVVGVELCRDRLGLLVDSSKDNAANILWHCRKIEVEGLPGAPEWPAWSDMRKMLTCRPGRPVTTADIEQDVVALLSTGLFRSVRPACKNADYSEAPAFLATPRTADDATSSSSSSSSSKKDDDDSNTTVQTVPPLGCIRFVVSERSLPPIKEMSFRLDSALKALGSPDESLAQIISDTLALNAPTREGGPVSALTCLLKAKQSIQGLFAAPVVVTFLGVETGQVEILVRLARDDDVAFISGFESSAAGGEGWGIEVFRPKKNLFKISDKMYLPQEVVDKIRAQARGIALPSTSASSSASSSSSNGYAPQPVAAPRSQYRLWSPEEVEACKPPMFEGSALADTLGAVLTALYARYQATAARKLDIGPGAAWQAALQAASEVGSQQVLLIDRPTVVTERKLADTLLREAGGRMGAALGLVMSTLLAAIISDALPPSTELAGFGGALAVAAALCWPVIGPLREMAQLSEMTPEQIEDTVAVKQPIASGDLSKPFKVYGEDALLDWPGALEPIIRDRDTFMAAALASAAQSGKVTTPLYMRDQVDGQDVWRYMMPEGGHEVVAPQGAGDGAAKPLSGVKTVVGVVGTAHVPGMVREWKDVLNATPDRIEKLLQA